MRINLYFDVDIIYFLVLVLFALEFATMWTTSGASDVYSFGILLLETFTGKGPRSNVFRRLTLREWVFKAHPTAILDVIDNNLLNDHPSNGQLQDRTTIHTFLMSIIELRLLCTRYSSKERISMTNVAA